MNVTTGRSAGAKWLGSIQRTVSTSVTKEMTVVLWDSTVVTAGSTAGPKRNSLFIVASFHGLVGESRRDGPFRSAGGEPELGVAATTPCTPACHIEDAGHGAPVGWASLARD